LGGSNPNLNSNTFESRQAINQAAKNFNSRENLTESQLSTLYSNNLIQKVNSTKTNEIPNVNNNNNDNLYNQEQDHNNHNAEFNLESNNNNHDEDLLNLLNLNKFDDDEDNLCHDIIEYNDDINEYFMNEKFQFLSNFTDQQDPFNLFYNAKNYEMATMGSYGTNHNGNGITSMATAAANKRQIDSLDPKNFQHENSDFFSLGLLVNNNNKTISTASTTFAISETLNSSSNANNNQEVMLRNQNMILDENRLY
jgi:hypothetical protein